MTGTRQRTPCTQLAPHLPTPLLLSQVGLSWGNIKHPSKTERQQLLLSGCPPSQGNRNRRDKEILFQSLPSLQAAAAAVLWTLPIFLGEEGGDARLLSVPNTASEVLHPPRQHLHLENVHWA